MLFLRGKIRTRPGDQDNLPGLVTTGRRNRDFHVGEVHRHRLARAQRPEKPPVPDHKLEFPTRGPVLAHDDASMPVDSDDDAAILAGVPVVGLVEPCTGPRRLVAGDLGRLPRPLVKHREVRLRAVVVVTELKAWAVTGPNGTGARGRETNSTEEQEQKGKNRFADTQSCHRTSPLFSLLAVPISVLKTI